MSKPQVQRLKRLESTTQILSAATTTLSMMKKGIQWLRTSIAGAQTINVPAATGESGQFNIYIGVTATGNKVIKAAAGSVMQGVAVMASTGTSGSFSTASNSNTITFTGSTSGGVAGTLVELRDVAPGVWSVKVHACATGVAVTPFSNT